MFSSQFIALLKIHRSFLPRRSELSEIYSRLTSRGVVTDLGPSSRRPGRAMIASERFVPLIWFKIQTQTPVVFRDAAARHVPQTQFSLALGTVPRSSDFCKLL
jgi:hypothetical protein